MSERNLEVTRIRLRIIDLIKSFFVSPPDAERLSRWRGTFAALAGEQISPKIDTCIRAMNRKIADKKLEQLQDEFYTLFTDPFSEHQLNLMASHHFEGRNFGQTLIAAKQFFIDADIDKAAQVKESEDSLPVLIDALATLIEKNRDGHDNDHLQARLVQDFLYPLTDHLTRAADTNQAADFYAVCLAFSNGYLALEQELYS